MEREILFKYVIKNKHTGVIYNKVYSLNQIEENGLKSLFDIENYEIIAKLRFTVLTDKNGVKIFEGDKLLHQHNGNENIKFIFIVKFIDNAFNCYHENIFDPDGSQSKWGGLWRFKEIGFNIEVIGSVHD